MPQTLQPVRDGGVMLLTWCGLIPTTFCAVVSVYLVVMTLAATRGTAQKGQSGEYPRCAVLVPAHNEAGQIEATLRHLYESAYPSKQFTVYVIADNCSDATASLARRAGATVCERQDPAHPGKGPALDWCLRQYQEITEQHEAVVIQVGRLREPPVVGDRQEVVGMLGVDVH